MNTRIPGASGADLAPGRAIALCPGRAFVVRNWRARLGAAVTSVALAATLFVSLGGPQAAHADKKVDEMYDDETGTVIEMYQNDKGDFWAWITYANGEIEIRNFFDNPSPDDDGRGQSYLPENVREFLEQFGGATDPPQEKWDNPLGVELTKRGEGIIPAHNPSDFEKGYDDGTGFGSGGPGFDPNGGDYTQQLKRNGGGGTPDGEEDEDPDRGEAGLFDAEMPGPPELVNPAPIGGR